METSNVSKTLEVFFMENSNVSKTLEVFLIIQAFS